MNQKQLANVLVKILGLSLCTQGVLHIVSVIINSIVTTVATRSSVLLLNSLSGLILGAVGVLLIVQSRRICDKLFKDE
jgi:hypothetical protein